LWPRRFYCHTRIPLNRKTVQQSGTFAQTGANVTTRRLAGLFLFLLIASSALCQANSGKTKKKETPPLSVKILEAKSVYLDCDCRKEMAVSVPSALPELLDWGRYQLVPDRHNADLILLYSMNPYLGDYLTRDGPDKRPALVDYTILTVIDGHTGQYLWTDYKRWGYMLVSRASRDLMHEFRLAVAGEVKSWTLDDILRCTSSPAYTAYANLTAQEALAKPEFAVAREADASNQLTFDPPDAPDFCKRAQLVVSQDNKIIGFEVLPAADTLDVGELIQQADQFDFAGGKDATNKPYFTAERKDKKLLIEYNMQGRMPILTRVRYLY